MENDDHFKESPEFFVEEAERDIWGGLHQFEPKAAGGILGIAQSPTEDPALAISVFSAQGTLGGVHDDNDDDAALAVAPASAQDWEAMTFSAEELSQSLPVQATTAGAAGGFAMVPGGDGGAAHTAPQDQLVLIHNASMSPSFNEEFSSSTVAYIFEQWVANFENPQARHNISVGGCRIPVVYKDAGPDLGYAEDLMKQQFPDSGGRYGLIIVAEGEPPEGGQAYTPHPDPTKRQRPDGVGGIVPNQGKVEIKFQRGSEHTIYRRSKAYKFKDKSSETDLTGSDTDRDTKKPRKIINFAPQLFRYDLDAHRVKEREWKFPCGMWVGHLMYSQGRSEKQLEKMAGKRKARQAQSFEQEKTAEGIIKDSRNKGRLQKVQGGGEQEEKFRKCISEFEAFLETSEKVVEALVETTEKVLMRKLRGSITKGCWPEG